MANLHPEPILQRPLPNVRPRQALQQALAVPANPPLVEPVQQNNEAAAPVPDAGNERPDAAPPLEVNICVVFDFLLFFNASQGESNESEVAGRL